MTEFQGSSKFESKFEVWRNNLLDMSHRNRQLFFRPTSRSIIEIIHPDIDFLFEKLVIDGKNFYFPPVFDEKAPSQKPGESPHEFAERKKEMHRKNLEEKMNLKTVRYYLLTEIPDRKLDRRLKKTRRRAKDSLEEQGINILYMTFGLLKWYESERDKDEDSVYTPLLFVPIDIYRDSVLDDYHVQIMDDDVFLNPSLVEKFKSEYNMELPEFPEEFKIEDFNNYLNNLAQFFLDRPKCERWEVTDRVIIGLFTFTKLTMFHDLEKFKEQLYNNKIVRGIAEGSGYEEESGNIPKKTAYNDYGEPLNTYHIMDCDRSQLKAIQYAKKGASMVIRGPPGTGKSQCISNIIAECLADDKKVLFVAEKRAALDVVKRRLDGCGIGEFCLELHSQKSNKLEVLKDILDTLKSELKKKKYKKNKYKSLRTQRVRLDEYVHNVHEPIGATGMSLYQRIGEYEKLSDIPLIKASYRNPLDFTDEMMFEIEDNLAQLDVYKDVLENYDRNPWTESGLTKLESNMRPKLEDQFDDCILYCRKIRETCEHLEEDFRLQPINCHLDLQGFTEFFIKYDPAILSLNLEGFVQKEMGWMDRRKIKKQIEKDIKNYNEDIEIEEYAQDVLNFKNQFLMEPYLSSYPNLERRFERVLDQDYKIEKYKSDLRPLIEQDRFQDFELTSEWEELEKTIEFWKEKIPMFNQWLSVELIISKLEDLGLKNFVQQLKNKVNPAPDVSLYDLFRKSFLRAWIEDGMNQFPNLINFNPDYHKKVLEKFKKLDQEIIRINRYRLAERLYKKRPKANLLTNGLRSTEHSILVREAMKKRNVKPLRQILSLTKNYITKIKPCFLMSPLSVAKYLKADDFLGFFDVVIFDEASQVTPEDAIGSIMRAKQLIVVGDEKQLPPTSFFSASLYNDIDDFASDVDVFDSILEECTGIGFPSVMLNYHYRSKKEGLIAFSNYHFYGNGLYTFPDLVKEGTFDSSDVDQLSAIEFHHVEDGYYDRGGTRTNETEASLVAQEIVDHYRDNDINGTDFSLGVVTFSQAQRRAVENALEELFKQDPKLEELVHKYDDVQDEPLFIKNLENVQGDERDFIFFSVGYAKDKESGKLSLNFGPINKHGGERRLNVAITRARYHVKIFCSFLPHEGDLSRTQSPGVHRLFEYLRFAQKGEFPMELKDKGDASKVIQSQFEEAVCEALTKRGYQIEREVGQSKYQIDIAILHPKNPNVYALGIVCDGGTYRAMKNARDRDRVRNQVLKSLGWDMYHIFSPEWLKDREAILDDIEARIEGKLTRWEEQKSIPLKAEDYEDNVSDAFESEENDLSVEFEEKALLEEEIEGVKLRDETTREELLKFPGVVIYTPYTKTNVYSEDVFNRQPSRMKAAREIIEKEGPIHWSLLRKRIKDYFGLSHMTNQQIEYMEEIRDSFPCEGDFYYPADYDEKIVRIELELNTDPRSFDQISALELRNAMNLFLSSALSLDKDELFTRTMQFFGFRGKRQDYIPVLEAILKDLMKAGNYKQDTIKGDKIESNIVDEDDINITQLLKDAEENSTFTEDEDAKGIVTFEAIIDVMLNGEEYTFKELTEEFDLEQKDEKLVLAKKLTQLMRMQKVLHKMRGDGDFYIINPKLL